MEANNYKECCDDGANYRGRRDYDAIVRSITGW
jgi:hypothetical protein